ncbi:MAG TPA: HAD family hydrolase [Candidatus Dojkabacteria bacterium]|jgi:hypothetical protein
MNTPKAVILDVDGVITGSKRGYNSPNPHLDVINKLKELNASGIKVSLNTGKPAFGMEKIVRDCDLDNMHGADGGGQVFNPLNGKYLSINSIPTQDVLTIAEKLSENSCYFEIYTTDKYFVEESNQSDITEMHAEVIHREPELVSDILDTINNTKVVKLLAVAKSDEEREEIKKIIVGSNADVKLSWGTHPQTAPLQYGVTTRKGISKESGAREILEYSNIKFEETLGVGDSMHDWQFIEHCGFKATLANASDEMQQTVKSAGGYIGPDIDENGILDILKYFGL